MTKEAEGRGEQPLEAKNTKEVEMEAVLKEINGHFLFDTLHAIKGYSLLDEEKAMDMINLLAKAMRQGIGMLKEGQPRVPVSDELEYVKLYLDIAKLHYGQITCEIRQMGEFAVPAFAIRHLAEEAFTRCLTNKRPDRKIVIAVFSETERDYIKITDTGNPLLENQIQSIMEKKPDEKRNPYVFLKNAGWDVSIRESEDKGNLVILSHERQSK